MCVRLLLRWTIPKAIGTDDTTTLVIVLLQPYTTGRVCIHVVSSLSGHILNRFLLGAELCLEKHLICWQYLLSVDPVVLSFFPSVGEEED